MRKLLLFVFISFTIANFAQVPRWILHPTYDKISILGNGYYVVSQNHQFGMLNAEEKEVVPLKYDSISPFKSHQGLLYNNNKFVGYVSDNGVVQDLSAGQYQVVGDQGFSDGYLSVHNNTGYYYIRVSDGVKVGPFTYAAPFCEGYAWVKIPKSDKHILDGSYSYNILSSKTGVFANLSLGEYDTEDIDFISSSSYGKCIIVLKKRFYEYDFKTNMLTPLATDNDPTNKKSRVIAAERPVNVIKNGNEYVIRFKQGVMTFDSLMRLSSITYTGQLPRRVTIPQEKPFEPQSDLKPIAYNERSLLGLSYNGQEILPAQFEAVPLTWNHDAIVKQNGKYGLITVDPRSSCRFIMNNNLDIGFEHKTINTDIKVVCPPYMTLSLMSLSSQDDNCLINIDTRKENVNVETAVLSYDCTLNIPDEIGLERTPSYSKFAINYDGLKFTPSVITYNTWYINNYTVQMLSHQINGSVLTAEILVRNTGTHDRTYYFRDVTIDVADSTICTISKVTEEMYSARLYEWKGDEVKFSVDITEDGCPTISYPFAISVRNSTANKKKAQGKENSDTDEGSVQSQGKVKRKSKPKAAPKKEEKKILLIPN